MGGMDVFLDSHPHFTSSMHTYVLSIYWVITTVTTTGYGMRKPKRSLLPPQRAISDEPCVSVSILLGDITPVNAHTILYTLVTILLGNILQAQIIGSLTAYTNSLNAPAAEHQRRIKSIRRYMRYRNISPSIGNGIMFSIVHASDDTGYMQGGW